MKQRNKNVRVDVGISLKEAMSEICDPNDYIYIHRYNVPGYFKYMKDDIGDKLLSNEVMLIRNHFGGKSYGDNIYMYVLK